MVQQHLHIISLQTPYPADFGGVMDLFCKLKYLKAAGIKIHLHCFTTTNEKPAELEKYCVEVHYYIRNKSISAFSLMLPFIVSSRKNKQLEERLLKDDYPVFFEGIHTTYLLHKNKLPGRKCLVRLHNVEFDYYRHLAKYETDLFKKLYFLFESKLLKKYEKSISNKASFLTVNEKDTETYRELFHAPAVSFLPVFIPYTVVNAEMGLGRYCLYQGNLAINENEKAVSWLIEKVFSKMEIPFVVAGKNPSRKLEKMVHRYKNCCLVANPPQAEMNDLVKKAQVNILPSFNNTGVKLKLIHALCNGRHCVVNAAGVQGSGLETFCIIAESPEEFQIQIAQLMKKEINEDEIKNRQIIASQIYNNEKNAAELIKWIH